MITRLPPLTCDVFVAGGGIAGLMAAIAAADGGADVILAEKANTNRSGSGATGNDHILCYIPEVHGEDPAEWLAEAEASQIGGCNDMDMFRFYATQIFDRVKQWDSWGIPMRPHGDWEFNGHAKPEHMRIWLKYAGQNQKIVLTREALKRGVRILNRTPFNEIITNGEGRAIGAVCVDLNGDGPAMQVISARSVVLATGHTSRLYTPKTPSWLFNTANCPACNGAGRAAAYRAGARLVNMDLPMHHAGPKYFSRCGKATWIGVYSDVEGRPVGPFVTKPTKELGDLTGDIWMGMFAQKYKAGEPVFMNCKGIAEEDLEYMWWGLSNEGNTGLMEHMAQEGIDVHRHMVEFTQYEPILIGRGIDANVRCETTVPGLYAASEELGNFRADMGGAAVFGWESGRQAALSARERAPEDASGSEIAERCAQLYTGILEREAGPASPDWREINTAVQQIMTEYCALEVRSEHLLSAGYQYIKRVQKKAEQMACTDAHTFMRCLEARDLAQVAELVILCARERKETRDKHIRVDYTFTNPMNNNKFVTIQQKDGQPVIGWRKKNK